MTRFRVGITCISVALLLFCREIYRTRGIDDMLTFLGVILAVIGCNALLQHMFGIDERKPR